MKLHTIAYPKRATASIPTKALTKSFASLLISLLLLISPPLTAQEQSNAPLLTVEDIPYHDVKTGSLYLKSPNGYFAALRQNSDYHVDVNGFLARVSFSQTFKNTSEYFLEAVYVFPLIDDAAVDSMVMAVGDRKIIGKIAEKQRAKKIYQQAKQQGKKASLVSQQRPNMFTTKLSNIAPGEIIKITISYLQSVHYNNDEFSLRIPLTVTPKYIPQKALPKKAKKLSLGELVDLGEVTKNEDDNSAPEIETSSVINNTGWADISPPQTRYSEGQKVNINLTLNTGLALTNIVSRYHQITKQQQNNTTHLSLINNSVLLDRDFVLTWQVSQGNAPKAAFFQMADESFNYGLLMVMPPVARQGEIIAKDVTYIIDTSGSMGGVAIKQAKQALYAALDILNTDDSFNIIAFSNNAKKLFQRSLSVTPKNITIAKHWLQKLSAGGGTNMYPAIKQALHVNTEESSAKSKYRQVIFITDGSVANEQELFTLIENNLANTRLHTIGIGSAPNSYFMSRAAELGRGTYRYIGSINEVGLQMQKLFGDISQPLMRNVHLDWPVDNVEYYPLLIPDLYQSQPMVISARWPKVSQTPQTPQKKLKSIIKVTGMLADKNWQEQIHIAENKAYNQANQGVDQWWARQKIKHLTQQHRRGDQQQKALLKQQITQLALKQHLVSPYTSFIAIEERISRNPNTTPITKKIANLMPKGSTQIVPLANTALGVRGYFYIGLTLLFIGLLLQLLPFKRKPLATNCKANLT